ncbi:MAG: Hsp70 family protein, partial [Myxococcota bacterium]
YGYGRQLRQRVAIYDLGGGTFDLSIMEIDGDIFEVLGTAGDSYLGGDDFDLRLVEYIVDRFYSDYGIDLRETRESLQKLRETCEQAKKLLSDHPEVLVSIPDLQIPGTSKTMNLEYVLSQDEFHSLVNDLVRRTFIVCDEAMKAARCSPQDLDGVIMVGGSTRMPIVREAVGHYFGKVPDASLNPDEVISLGAAIHAQMLIDSGAGERGMASAHLLDVTPLSLRIGTVGGYTEVLIERNTPIPIERSKVFTTVRDGQDCVKIRIYQGESKREEYNVMLGCFDFTGLPLAARGKVKIEVSFRLDASGIVHVTAKDLDTGKQQRVSVELSSALSEEEVELLRLRGGEIRSLSDEYDQVIS